MHSQPVSGKKSSTVLRILTFGALLAGAITTEGFLTILRPIGLPWVEIITPYAWIAVSG